MTTLIGSYVHLDETQPQRYEVLVVGVDADGDWWLLLRDGQNFARTLAEHALICDGKHQAGCQVPACPARNDAP